MSHNRTDFGGHTGKKYPRGERLMSHRSLQRKGRYNISSKGQRADEMARKRDERVVRQAYKKERKAQAYLADDGNFQSFAVQLAKLGLQLRDIPGDG